MKLYSAEMHCHTKEVSPCSRIHAKYLVGEYIDLGYRYMFITDHYHPMVFETQRMSGKAWNDRVDIYLSGYKAAQKAAEGSSLKVLLGMELTLGMNKTNDLGFDFLVFGFDEDFIRNNPYLYNMEYMEFYEAAKKKGFLVFQAHPYRYGLTPVEPICYDGIEIVNANTSHNSRNQLAISFAMEKGLYTIGGSDAHSEEDAGRGGIMLPGDIETPADLVQYYKENGSPELIVTFGA